jgi:LacI family transcriptional regulator
MGRPIREDAPHRVVAEDIRKRIVDGEWAVGSLLPSIRALAEAYGVGRQTVTLAFEELKDEGRVRATPRKRLTVVRTDDLTGKASDPFLLVMPNFSGYRKGTYSTSIWEGISAEALSHDLSFLTVPGFRFREALPQRLLQLPLSGILLFGHFRLSTFRKYEKLRVPVILVDRPRGRLKCHSVAAKNEEAACEATRRLIDLGHRRIAFLRYVSTTLRDIDPDARERQRGFARAFKEAGVRLPRGHVFNYLSGGSRGCMTSLLEADPPFTAVVSAGGIDDVALEQHLRKRDLRVPKDMSIVSFAEVNTTRVTGPRIDFPEIGRQAVELLSAPKFPPRQMRVGYKWVRGQTIAPPP